MTLTEQGGAMSAAVMVTISTGELGAVISWDGTTLVFHSPRAFAPGAPVKLQLALSDGPIDVELKAGGSRRAEGDAFFEVRGRAMNLRRATREKLNAALQGRRAASGARNAP